MDRNSYPRFSGWSEFGDKDRNSTTHLKPSEALPCLDDLTAPVGKREKPNSGLSCARWLAFSFLKSSVPKTVRRKNKDRKEKDEAAADTLKSSASKTVRSKNKDRTEKDEAAADTLKSSVSKTAWSKNEDRKEKYEVAADILKSPVGSKNKDRKEKDEAAADILKSFLVSKTARSKNEDRKEKDEAAADILKSPVGSKNKDDCHNFRGVRKLLSARYTAAILDTSKNVLVSLGTFDTAEAAARAYDAKAKVYHGPMANLNFPFVEEKISNPLKKGNCNESPSASPCSTVSTPMVSSSRRRLNKLGMDVENKDIVSDFLRFVECKETCLKLRRTWKRVYLLYNPPGIDRSRLIAAMANYLQFRIHNVDGTSFSSLSDIPNMLASIQNRSLIWIQDFAQSATPGMLPDLNTIELRCYCLKEFVCRPWLSCDHDDERIIVFSTNNIDLHEAAQRCLHMFSPYPVALPAEGEIVNGGEIVDEGEIMQLYSFEQKPPEHFDATNNGAHQSSVFVPNTEKKNTREASNRRCMTEGVLNVVDPSTKISSKEFDAPDNDANLLRAHQGSPIVLNSEKKDTIEGVGGECLTNSVLSLDDSGKQEPLPDFDATENKAYLFRADHIGSVVSLSENKNRGEALKSNITSILGLEDLQQHCGDRGDAAAKTYGPGIASTTKMEWKSSEVLETLLTKEQPIDCVPLLAHARFLQQEKTPDVPRVMQISGVEQKVTKIPRCLGELTSQSASSSGWPIFLLDGEDIVLLDPLDQSRENMEHVAKGDKCPPTVFLTEKKMVRRTLKRKWEMMSVIFEGNHQHFGRRCGSPAKSLGAMHICRKHGIIQASTLKRIYKQRVHQWPFRQISKNHIHVKHDNSGSTTTNYEGKNTGETSDGQGIAMSLCSVENPQQHFGSKQRDAVKRLGVKTPMFKSTYRQNWVYEQPCQIKNMILRRPDPHGESNLSPTFKMPSNGQMTMENDMGGQNPEPIEFQLDSFENLSFSNIENGSMAGIENLNARRAQPQIESREVLNENKESSEDKRNLLASQAEVLLEGHVSESSDLTFLACSDARAPSQLVDTILHTMPAIPHMIPLLTGSSSETYQGEGQSMHSTSYANLNPIVFPQHKSVNMGNLEDWRASEQECLLEGYVCASTNSTVTTCLGPSLSQQPMPTAPYKMRKIPHMMPYLTARQDTSFVLMMTTYGGTLTELQLPLAYGIIELKEEVAMRLKLELDSFDVKYKDEEGDWILIPCDEDLRHYLQLFSSVVNPVIKLLVVNKDANPTNVDPMDKQSAKFGKSAMDPDYVGIISDLLRILSKKEFYRKEGKAWMRFYLLYEPPGSDSSSLIAAMAKHLKFDIFDLDLTSMSSILDLKYMLLSTTNCSFIVIQDFDHCAGMFPNHKNELTVSCLLKYVDGLFSRCGDERIIVFTTKHRDQCNDPLLPLANMDIYIPAPVPQPAASPDGEAIVQVESFKLLDFDATNNRADSLAWKLFKILESPPICKESGSIRHLVPWKTLTLEHSVQLKESQDLPPSLQMNCSGPLSRQSASDLPVGGRVISLSKKKMVRKTLKRKSRTTSVLCSEDHHQHADKRWGNTVKSLGGVQNPSSLCIGAHAAKRICWQLVLHRPSTAKCTHKQHGIHRWPFQQDQVTVKGYYLEGQRPVEVISLSMGWNRWILVSRLRIIYLSWPVRYSPRPSALSTAGRIVGRIALSSSEFDTTNDRADLTRQDQRGYTSSHSGNKRARETANYGQVRNTKFSLQDLQECVGLKRIEAAIRLDVSEPTFKRRCRELGITDWRNWRGICVWKPPDPRGRSASPTCQRSSSQGQTQKENQMVDHPAEPNGRRSDLLDGSVTGNPVARNLETPAFNNDGMNLNISSFFEEMERELMGSHEEAFHCTDQPTLSVPHLEAMHGSGSSYGTVPDPTSFQPMSSILHTIPTTTLMMPTLTPSQDTSSVTVKAYADNNNTLRFQLPLTSGVGELKDKVAMRLKLRNESFELKYEDDERELILIACDEDLSTCLQHFSSLPNPIVKLVVVRNQLV